MNAHVERRCIILGGGGHAAVLIEAIQTSGAAQIHGILDTDPKLWRTQLFGAPILGDDHILREVIDAGVNCFVIGVGSIGSNQHRRRLFELAAATGLAALTVVHPSAICSRSAKVGAGSVLFPGTAINAGAVIGINVIINTAAVVEHDCRIGDHAHIASGAVLSGTVEIGQGAFVGAGAVIRQSVSIGEAAIVGAGAVVVRDVEPGAKVVGVPARSIK